MEGFSLCRVVFLMLLLFVILTVGQKDSNDICKEKDKPDFKLNLTGAMVFPEYILMIDSKLQMYEVPKSNYEGSYGKMTINIKGVPIEEYWPPFKNSKEWECVKKQYKSIYHLINQFNGVILINIFINRHQCVKNGTSYSLCYNLKTKKFCPSRSLPNHMQLFVDTGLKVYDITPTNVTTKNRTSFFPMINTWRFKYEDDNQTISKGSPAYSILMFYLVEKSNSSNRNVSVYNAQDFTDPIDPPPTGYRRENITDWNISEDYTPVGYLYNGSFYLYALDKVIIFEDKMPSYERQKNSKLDGSLMASSKVTVIPLSDYFQCESANLPNVTHPPDGKKTVSTSTDSTSTDSGTMLILIVAVVAVLLILIVAAILIYCCLNKKNGKEKKSKSKKVASKVEKPSLASSSVAGSKVSSKIGEGGSKMTSKQSSIADGGKNKAATSTSVAGASGSKMMQSKIAKKKYK